MKRVFFLFFAMVVGCGGGPVELAAHSYVDRSDTLGFTPRAPGNRLVVAEVTLTNRTGASIPVTPAQFFLEPVSGASAVGIDFTTFIPEGCGNAGDALAPERDLRCFVAFEISASFEAELIAYEHDGRRAEAVLPALGMEDAGMMDAGMDAAMPDAGPFDAGMRDAGPAPPTNRVDLLFMIDNSNSMTEEQMSLAAEIPEMIRILATGDLSGDGIAELAPVQDLNVGVVTSDMGTGGYVIPTCADSNFGDDGILQTEGNTSIGCMTSYPAVLSFMPPDDPALFASHVQCVASIGTGGCGFEQQLEAILKAVTPTVANSGTSVGFIPIGTLGAPDGLHRPFFMNSDPHGDRENAGFVRPDSVLALVPLTDEEDCSAHDAELFNPSGGPYAGVDLNLRCFSFPEAQHPIERYVHGYQQLRPYPSRLVYAPIVGIPVDLAPAPSESPNYDLLISPDLSIRDDRMEQHIDPTMTYRLAPSCDTPGRGVAFPPVRIVQVAQGLEAVGARVTVQSICQADFTGVLLEVVRRIYLGLGGSP